MSSDTRSEPVQEASPADGAQAAAHLLELAARDVELWRSEARSEADTVLEDARTEAHRLVEAGRREAERLTTEARTEADQVRSELAEERRRQEGELAGLKQLEDEHRTRVRSHLNDLMQVLDAPRSEDDGPSEPHDTNAG